MAATEEKEEEEEEARAADGAEDEKSPAFCSPLPKPPGARAEARGVLGNKIPSLTTVTRVYSRAAKASSSDTLLSAAWLTPWCTSTKSASDRRRGSSGGGSESGLSSAAAASDAAVSVLMESDVSAAAANSAVAAGESASCRLRRRATAERRL